MNVQKIQMQIEKLHLDKLRDLPEKIREEDRYRRSFYLLPLFIQWIIGITWETKAEVCKSAERGMALFLIFGLGTVGTFVFTGILSSLFPSLDWLANLIGLVTQSATGLFYLGASLYYAANEYAGKEVDAPYLDRIFNWVSAYTSA